MTLGAYLAKEKITPAEFAVRLGVARYSVERYCQGRVPKPSVIARIRAITSGRVQPGDFYAEPRRKEKRA